MMVLTERRCSKLSRPDLRWVPSLLDRPSWDLGRAASVSKARSSSMVSSTSTGGGGLAKPLGPLGGAWTRSS